MVRRSTTFLSGAHRMAMIALAAAFLLPQGCAPPLPEPEPAESSADDPQDESSDPAWTVVNDQTMAMMPDAADDPELQEAIDAARSTSEGARNRWAEATDRDSWLIKWEAPLVDGGIEYLWVRPEIWTPHRIEGVLANAPQHQLEFDAAAGDRVSFPAEQLADWIHFLPDGSGDGEFEGGTTHRLILERHGPPAG